MALASSGAISFAQIAAEFGGTAPHSLSEYYPLLAQGVTGLPSSGTFNFSHFHGKDKDVATWTASGYNSSAWVNIGTIHGAYYHHNYQGNNNWINKMVVAGTHMWNTNSYTSGNTRYRSTGAVGANKPLYRDSYTTTWNDTSGNVWTVASISG